MFRHQRLVGLEAWFSLRVREVPGSIPGPAQIFYIFFFSLFELYGMSMCLMGEKLDFFLLLMRKLNIKYCEYGTCCCLLFLFVACLFVCLFVICLFVCLHTSLLWSVMSSRSRVTTSLHTEDEQCLLARNSPLSTSRRTSFTSCTQRETEMVAVVA